jgi:hypothetical protein
LETLQRSALLWERPPQPIRTSVALASGNSRPRAKPGLTLRQEFLSHVLGMRRAGLKLTELPRRGLIATRRGLVVVCDHKGIEAAACERYGSLKSETRSLMAA